MTEERGVSEPDNLLRSSSIDLHFLRYRLLQVAWRGHYSPMNTFTTFEIADYLDSDDLIAEFLTAALEDEKPELFIAALGHVAKAKGMDKTGIADGGRPI